ncbi:ATP-dependent protease HslVU (ClpYQ) ATPase subunit [Methylobacterium sp. R2-1]|nr:ATP-dependent protease HslVU (ClpYQ) ATPase subunit [Methylobacterium sp. R2-1]
MPTNDADAIAEVAALCAAARAKLPASGFRRLRVLLDMLLIDLGHAAPPADEPVPDLRPDATASTDHP